MVHILNIDIVRTKLTYFSIRTCAFKQMHVAFGPSIVKPDSLDGYVTHFDIGLIDIFLQRALYAGLAEFRRPTKETHR